MLLLVLVPGSLAAIEPRDSHRLDVSVERIDEDVIVDGVAMRIQVARGAGVPELARRIAGRWRTEGGELQELRQRDWQMLARWQEGRSELIQWRGTGGSAELLHSRLDTTRAVARRGAPPFTLPSSCEWGRLIEGRAAGRRHAAQSARCRTGLPVMRELLLRSLRAQGWTMRHQSGAALQLARAGLQGELLLAADGTGGSSIVWVGSGQ